MDSKNSLKYNWKSTLSFIKDNKVYVLIILILVMCIFILDKTETFITEKNNDVIYEKDRTLLYGSLFLDKLNEQIKTMTDPKIQYDNKRIDIIKYSDLLL
jgi:hypothetical protein